MNADDLLMDIVKCGINCRFENSPCRNIWTAQGCKSLMDFQLPEPWNGDIENAKIMFLSINPRATIGELFPRMGCNWWGFRKSDGEVRLDRAKVVDFFMKRFSSQYKYVQYYGGCRYSIRYEDGSCKNPKSKYWPRAYETAKIVLKNPHLSFGEGYVITEVVHCKTADEKGVSPACYDECTKRWLDAMFSVAAKVEMVIIPGGRPRVLLSKKFGIANPRLYTWYEKVWNSRRLKFLFVPHFSYWGKNGFDLRKICAPVDGACIKVS